MVLRQYNPVSFSQVKITDKFWAPRQEINHTVTVPITYQRLKESGRIDAFRLNWNPGMKNPPHRFGDSDVAKWLETASFCLKINPDPELASLTEETVQLVLSAQQSDGYLNTYFTVVKPGQRWTNIRNDHELYCAGHMLEAAVAHYDATNKRHFLDAMIKYIDYIDTVFGLEENKMQGYPGHEELELALVKLYNVTKNPKYLNLAKYFIDERGKKPYYYEQEAQEQGDPLGSEEEIFDYMKHRQAHYSPREQKEMVGHAVRAFYLYSGMMDVANETEDEALLKACKILWEDATLKKMYVTGGFGSSGKNEGITSAYDLPNETGYAETCAAIGAIFFNHRLLQHEVDGRYSDALERSLYNGAISGVSLDGEKFFYENPLTVNPTRRKMERKYWYYCPCCPNNISRLIASLGQYIYSKNKDEVLIHLYIQNEASVEVADQIVHVKLETNYPWEGSVKIILTPEQRASFTVKVRIPGWCREYTVSINEETVNLKSDKGYIAIHREWTVNDQIFLNFSMPIERVYSHPKVLENAGRVALQRGPVVYCFEEIDNSSQLDNILLPQTMTLEEKLEPELLGGVVTISTKAFKVDEEDWNKTLYRTESPELTLVSIKAVPYSTWANRQVGEMLVWIRELPDF